MTWENPVVWCPGVNPVTLKTKLGTRLSSALTQMLSGENATTDVGSPRMLRKFEDNHLWHSGFPWDTVLNNWPYFWAEWMPKLNFCSVGTRFIPSHLSSELAILALHSLSYLCRINLGSFWSLSPLGWEGGREAARGIPGPRGIPDLR